MSQPRTSRSAPMLLLVAGALVVIALLAIYLRFAPDAEPETGIQPDQATRAVVTAAPGQTSGTVQNGGLVCQGEQALPYLQAFNPQLRELKSRAEATQSDQSRENFELQKLLTEQLRQKVERNTVPECLKTVQQEFLGAIDAVIAGYALLSDDDVANDQQAKDALIQASAELDQLGRALENIELTSQ